MQSSKALESSFRDPSGFVFIKNGIIFRQVNLNYKENYEFLKNSGLYQSLVNDNFLVSHEEISTKSPNPEIEYRVIKPENVHFISYPYEWSFSQLKNAALTMLKIQRKSLDYGMSLKDCSAYNIQFVNCKPKLIDTLSFEIYREGRPWIAYRQFCQHFLSPLALMSLKDIRLNQLLRIYIDGVPLDLASSLLPLNSYLKPSLLSHIHLHSTSQKYFSKRHINKEKKLFSRSSLIRLTENLESIVNKLHWTPEGTEWANYYEQTNYLANSFNFKKEAVNKFLNMVNPKSVWDLGANIGVFSRIASDKGINTLSIDTDPAAVEKNYLECLKNNENAILPLVIDLTNPSPSIGWNNHERISLIERGPADTVFALALIHHLAITNNVPIDRIAKFFSQICDTLIIEFISKNDSQVQNLLLSREDIFTNYTKYAFENDFKKYYNIIDSIRIINSERFLYLMKRR